MTINIPLALLLVHLQLCRFDFAFPSARVVDKVRLARLPVHLVPSLDRMQPPPQKPEEMRVYLRGPIKLPGEDAPYIVPRFNSLPPAIELNPPSLDIDKSPIQLSPPTIAPEQMHIQLGAPIVAPAKSPIQLSPPNFQAPSYPFPTITAPQ